MTVPKEEILQALKTIKTVCLYYEDHGYKDCKNCPLCMKGTDICGVTRVTPDNWEFRDNDNWKAFKVND